MSLRTKNEKRKANPFFKVRRKQNTKTEIQIRFSKWWENEKQKTKVKSSFQSKAKNGIRKPKFKSPFQSAAKTKNEKRNSNPFFSVTSRQKTTNRNGNGIPFYKPEEKRKIKWNLNSISLCHRKTVGTKVHALSRHFPPAGYIAKSRPRDQESTNGSPCLVEWKSSNIISFWYFSFSMWWDRFLGEYVDLAIYIS